MITVPIEDIKAIADISADLELLLNYDSGDYYTNSVVTLENKHGYEVGKFDNSEGFVSFKFANNSYERNDSDG